MSAPLDLSQLQFPSAHFSLNHAVTSLKRIDLSISNRLNSIVADAAFVEKVGATYRLPLIANERCGGWYVRPEFKAGSAYFKSTDGHHGQWAFSLRRLNLLVLEVIGEHGGCIIVDSTRKGKSMSDALSKTVAIWAAVLNRLLFSEELASEGLQTPENVVSRSEHARIEERIPEFVADAGVLQLDKQNLRAMLRGKPLEAVWVTPDSVPLESIHEARERNLVVLCTASGRTSSERPVENYVQGAADDSESWARGLDPVTFWRHRTQLLAASENELPALIQHLVSSSKLSTQLRRPVLIQPTANVWMADNEAAKWSHTDVDFVVSCSELPIAVLAGELKDRYIHICCTTGKVGSRQLRAELQKVGALSSRLSPSTRILVTCHTGKDLAVGVALAILCLCCAENGAIRPVGPTSQSANLSKTAIKHRLSWIMVSAPHVTPSRATLQSVNAFLLG